MLTRGRYAPVQGPSLSLVSPINTKAPRSSRRDLRLVGSNRGIFLEKSEGGGRRRLNGGVEEEQGGAEDHRATYEERVHHVLVGDLRLKEVATDLTSM